MENAIEREKAILIAIDNERGILTAEKSLEELKELAKTAGADTVCMVIQKRQRPHPALYVGTGKVDEIKLLIDETGATMVIADDELSSSQMRNLSSNLDIKVLDRTVLILDIFAAHASSREGKIQVELAQQKYRLSHLSGMGVQMSRLGGGIGTRGPGEKKLETDKRHIRDQITNLSDELKEIEKHRAVLRKSSDKSGIPVVSMVGYTNAGKSTLLNAVTDAGVFAEDQLFATLDTTTRRLKLPGGSPIQFTDTVGFISKLPHQLVKAFRATLEELNHADILLHIIDAAGEDFKSQITVVNNVLIELGASDKPIIMVYNKIDLCDVNDFGISNRNGNISKNVCISAKKKIGLERLMLDIEDVLKSMRKQVKFRIPYSEGGLISIVHGKAEIVSETHEASGVLIEAFVDDEVLGRVSRFVVE